MKGEIVVTHTINQTDIPALLDTRVTNTPSVKMLCPQNNCMSLYFRRNITCLRVGLLKIGQAFFCLPQNCVQVVYETLLSYERYLLICNQPYYYLYNVKI